MHINAALLDALIFLSAAVIAVPLSKKLGLGAVVGCLAAGTVIGPFGFNLFTHGEEVMQIAELGIVFLFFLIGLDLQRSRLIAMWRDIFGLGGLQVVLTGGALSVIIYYALGLDAAASIIVGCALAISSTAFSLRLVEERGELNLPVGRKVLALNLFQDMALIPLLAVLPLLDGNTKMQTPWLSVGAGLLAIAGVIAFGRYAINPILRFLASTGIRDVLTAAALLIVIGAAVLMQVAGLSMAMGAFLAGLLLTESTYRHQIEADIAPFRGLFLGLFFIAIGLSIDWALIAKSWMLVGAAVLAILAIKAIILYLTSRFFKATRYEALEIASLMAQAGEAGFVVFAAALTNNLIDTNTATLLVGIVALSMVCTPGLIALTSLVCKGEDALVVDDEDFSEATGSVLVIGFGRFGQVVCQALLARGLDVTTVDNDVEMIDTARRFGFRVFYGDGTRYDVLRAAGAERVKLVCVCTDKRDTTTHIVDILRSGFPLVQIFARSFDRTHTLELLDKGVDFEMRETYESAIRFGTQALQALGFDEEQATATEENLRVRDTERLALQRAGDRFAGGDKLYTRPNVRPEPLTKPRTKAANDDSETLYEAREAQIDGGAGL